jgi:hypothetical protein
MRQQDEADLRKSQCPGSALSVNTALQLPDRRNTFEKALKSSGFSPSLFTSLSPFLQQAAFSTAGRPMERKYY